MTLMRAVVVAMAVTSAACGRSGITGNVTAPTPPVATSSGQQVTGVPPTVISVFPDVVSTAGDAWGTVIGTGFQPGATIRFGATVINSVFRESTTIQFARSGQHAPGAVDLTVINPGGDGATLAGAYTYAPPDSFDADGVWNAPIVSGHKLNSCNWLPSSIWSNWEPTSKTAVEMGVFSKSVTLRICRSL